MQEKITGMIKRDSYFELQNNRPLKYLFLFVFGTVIISLLFIFRYYFWPFLFAVMLYLTLRPAYDFLQKYLKVRGISAGILILILIVLVLTPLLILTIAAIEQVFQLYAIIQHQIDSGVLDRIYSSAVLQQAIGYLNISTSELITKATNIIERASGQALSSVRALIAYPLSFIIDFFFLLLMLFFMFKDGHHMSSIFYKTLPFPDDMEKDVIDRLKEVIRVLLTGNLLIMILQGLMVGIGLRIAGIPVALLGGSIAAVLSLIPIVGTTLVWAPAVFYLIITGSYLTGLFLGVWCLGWYLILENIVKPKLFGKRLHFHPVIFFFLLLGSIQAFSLPGIIIGPLLLTLFYSFWEIYKLMNSYDRYHYEEKTQNDVPEKEENSE